MFPLVSCNCHQLKNILDVYEILFFDTTLISNIYTLFFAYILYILTCFSFTFFFAFSKAFSSVY